jgi:hypothetical protein
MTPPFDACALIVPASEMDSNARQTLQDNFDKPNVIEAWTDLRARLHDRREHQSISATPIR